MTQHNPLEVIFHGLPRADDVEASARAHLGKLEQLYPHLHGCRVAVEAEGGRHASGSRYHVKLQLNVPGKELVVGGHPSKPGHDDVDLALSDAFHALERQLKEFVRMRRGDVKQHAPRDEAS